jgi:NYN domain
VSNVAWFVDGAYFSRCWSYADSGKPDWLRFFDVVEGDAGEALGPAYFFDATSDPTSAASNPYYGFLQLPRPDGPGFRLVLGSVQKRELEWPNQMGGGKVLHPDNGQPFVQTIQKEVDVLLAFNLVRSQTKVGWKKLYLVAGDKDFYEPVKHLVENEGVEVSMFGLRNNHMGLPTIASKYGPYATHLYFEDIAHQIAEAANA